jgi:hypothetical protein
MIAFTICSNNYLYKAQVLAESIKKIDNIPVYLFLVDNKEETIGYADLYFTKVIWLNELNIPNLQWMMENYSLVEFNTAIKPFAFKYILENSDATYVYYFDPDIKLYQSLSEFSKFWEDKSILLTPHILSPLPYDKHFPGENLFLNHGIYNLGFLALKRGDTTNHLLTWWAERLLTKCIIDLKEGFFVDQIWFNLVPLFFKSTMVIEHYGCNMAYWNLHERTLTLKMNEYIVNNEQPLIFYHFSGVDATLSQIVSIDNYRHQFAGNETLKKLYQDYLSDVDRFTPTFFKSFKYFNGKYPFVNSTPSVFDRIARRLKLALGYG